MRIRIIVVATVMVYFSIGCSSESTTTTDLELEESPTEQTVGEIDSMPTNPLEGIGSLQIIGSGFSFLEGPVYQSSDSPLLFSDIPADTADGMAVDAEGNVFVTSAAGVEVFAPDGTRWGVIDIPEQATNCTFGCPDNRTLFVTGATSLYSVELQ